MGNAHARPFENSLIDVDNGNLVVTYKREGHLSKPIHVFLPYFSRGDRVRFTQKANLIVGDRKVTVVEVDEGVLEGSDMSGIHLKGFLVKNQA